MQTWCSKTEGKMKPSREEKTEYKAAHYLFICKHSSHLPRDDHMEILILKQSARGKKGESFCSFSYPLIFNDQHLHMALMGPSTWASVPCCGESVLATHGISRLAFGSRSGRRCKDLWGSRWTGSLWMRPRQSTWWRRQPEGRELCGGSRLSLAHSRFFRMLLISERLSCDSVHFF